MLTWRRDYTILHECKSMNKVEAKRLFSSSLQSFVSTLNSYVSTPDGQWAIKGFIDAYRRVYTISADTKVVSKLLEIHLFPKLLEFGNQNNYKVVPASKQNYYPDISFVSKDKKIKFAVDFKTTYRLPEDLEFCNGFTLGSHGNYFVDRTSHKNIQYPYKEYAGHFCLGIIYTRAAATSIDETKFYGIDQLNTIPSVIKDIQFFVSEKWKIASDKRGSGNTANIGSINKIVDIISGNGVFSMLGEVWFDDYWMNYDKITITDDEGETKRITNLMDFVKYREGDTNLIKPRATRRRARAK